MAPFRRIARATNLVGVAALTSAIVIVTIAVAVFNMRSDAIETAASHIRDMSAVLADDVANSIAGLDLTLRDAVEITQSTTTGATISEADAEAIQKFLALRRQAMGQTQVIAVANASGQVVSAADDALPMQVFDINDREYFTALRDGAVHGLFISKPLENKLNGKITMFLARRIDGSHGQFLGVAFVGVEPAQLFRNHGTLKADNDRSFSLFYEDGTVGFREPNIAKLIGKSGILNPSANWSQVVKAGGGLYHVQGLLDPRPRYVSVSPVVGHPFFVNVGVTDSAVFAAWRSRATMIVLAGLVGQALIGALLYSQSRLTGRLTRTRMRAWMRAKRLKTKELELSQSRDRFGLSMDYISQGFAIYDAQERLLCSNRSYAEIYGVPPEQIHAGMSAARIIELRIAYGSCTPAAAAAYDAANRDATNKGEQCITLNDGRIVSARLKRTTEGGWMTVQEDVTERMRAVRELTYAVGHDNLTQLGNRQAFKDLLAERFKSPSNPRFGLLLADLDGFREVNDTYGQEVGDVVLVEVAKRLVSGVGEGFVARLGGDEFAVVLAAGAVEIDALKAVAECLVQAAQAPIFVDGRRITLGLSVAVKIVDPATSDLATAMRRADLTLGVAKVGGGNCIREYHPDMERDYHQRIQLEQDLRAAIDKGQLSVHYQPIVSAYDGAVICMEALARWRHPTRGMISPGVFIPLAEEIGMINAIGDWVLHQACMDAAQWRSEIVVAVNASSLQVERPDYVSRVMAALEASKLCPQRLQLEITESVLLRNNEATTRHMATLRALGVTFALDDFGTGYASLAYLKTFPLDKIKIDKTFVDDVCVDTQSIAIVGAIVGLASGLGVGTTAEGVETREQYEALRAIGVQSIQGYYFCKPKAIGDHDRATIFADETGSGTADARAA